MIDRDHNDQIRRSLTRINTKLNEELLVGDGWESVVYAELLRHQLEVQAYHSQQEGKPSFQKTAYAAEVFEEAARKFEQEHDTVGDGNLERNIQ